MTKATGFEILPAIDLRGGRVVRLRQGDFARETVYGSEPTAVATGFVDAGARRLHVVDLDGARTGTPANRATIAAIVEAVGSRAAVEVAGGLRDERSVGSVLDSGAARAVVGTAALEDLRLAARLVTAHGAGRIAVAIDIRDGSAVGHAWTPGSPGTDVERAIDRLADVGIETFEVTAIDRDGSLEGPDVALYTALVDRHRGSIIASGGFARLEDIDAVLAVGCSGAIIGRALYEGRIDLRTAIARYPGS